MSCTRCGRDAPTAEVSFHTHVGLIVLWYHAVHAGRFCRICVGEQFWRSFLITLLFGWWGVFSAFVTLLFALPMNVVSYLRGSGLPHPGSGEAKLTAQERARERELRFGMPALTLGVWSLLHWALTAGLTAGALALGFGAQAIPYWAIPLVVLLPDPLLTLVYAAIALRKVMRVAHGTTGRARLAMLGWSAIARAAGMIGLAAVLALAMTDSSAVTFGLGATEPLPLGPRALWETLLMVTAGQGTYEVLWAFIGVLGLGALLELGAAIGAWFLVPRGARAVFWLVLDALLILGFTAVTLLLPIRPPESAPDAWHLPSIRLGVTTLFVARALFRLVPFVLDVLEGRVRVTLFGVNLFPFAGGFRLSVASRMLRARKSGFLTAIGALSILAVAFSSCTLTTTLSVMGGFRNDLKRKILGNNAHVVIDREHASFDGWQPTLEIVRAQDHVVGATPYVQGEVMITSATNLSGAILRGIDPETIGDVTELPRNLRHGRLEYLSSPERLLRLRADEMGRGLLAPPMNFETLEGDPFEPPPPPIPGRTFLEEAQRVIEDHDALVDERARVEHEIDDFLLPEVLAPSTDTTPPEPEVLPGLIVGQELARTLRLHVGDTVDVVSPFGDLGPSGPMPRVRPFRVAGIFYSGMYEFDMKMAYTTVEDAQRFLDLGSAISGIEVKLDDGERAEPIARAIASSIGRDELRVRAWQEVNRNLFGALQLEKLAMFIVLGIAILVASFCIIASLTLMVQEKRKEVGILKAMGATGEQITAVFMIQGLMIGLLGAGVGLGLGYLACFAAEHFGVIPLNPEVYYIDRLPVHVDPMEFTLVGVSAVVICLLATIYPAVLGSLLRPIDALRYT